MSDPFAEPNLPFDNPVEADFAWHIAKYLRDDVHVDRQVPVKTICGRFVLDFVAINPAGLRVAFECDGKEFYHATRDEWRDAMILGAHAVDSILRLRGRDLAYHVNASMNLPTNIPERKRPWLVGTAWRSTMIFRILLNCGPGFHLQIKLVN